MTNLSIPIDSQAQQMVRCELPVSSIRRDDSNRAISEEDEDVQTQVDSIRILGVPETSLKRDYENTLIEHHNVPEWLDYTFITRFATSSTAVARTTAWPPRWLRSWIPRLVSALAAWQSPTSSTIWQPSAQSSRAAEGHGGQDQFNHRHR